MKTLTLGRKEYRLVTTERDGRWLAHAERLDTGDPFGIECGGSTETQALDRLSRWLQRQAAEAADHHPDISINYKRVTLTYATHSEGGLTVKDFEGAATADGMV